MPTARALAQATSLLSRSPTLGELIQHCGSRFHDRTALRSAGAELSYEELAARVQSFSYRLSRSGEVGHGTRVALVLPNGIDLLVAYFGALTCGAVVSALEVGATQRELTRTLRALRPARLITSADLPHAEAAALKLSIPTLEACEAGVEPVGFTASEYPVGARDLALCPFSSGTTGLPKGVLLTHDNLLSNVRSLVARAVDLPGEHTVFGCSLPLHHVFPLTLLVLFPFALGAEVVLIHELAPQALLRTMTRNRVDFFVGVPPMFALLNRMEESSLAALPPNIYWASGGAPLAPDVRQTFESRFRTPLFQGYGLTETSPVLTWNVNGHKSDSVGCAVPGVELRIVDDSARVLEPGSLGEVEARGANVMRGYLDDPEGDEKVLRDGWFRTGDLGSLDDDGYLTLMGRQKELISVGAEKFAPEEVDGVLLEHPLIVDAAVVAEADSLRGESVTAFVVTRPSAGMTRREIVRHCRQHLAPYKVPRRVRFVGEIPRNAVGKVVRSRLGTE